MAPITQLIFRVLFYTYHSFHNILGNNTTLLRRLALHGMKKYKITAIWLQTGTYLFCCHAVCVRDMPTVYIYILFWIKTCADVCRIVYLYYIFSYHAMQVVSNVLCCFQECFGKSDKCKIKP